MPNLHDIERRINSVSSTKQITRTMEMVAAAKIRRASERVAAATPWTSSLTDMLTSTAKYAPLDAEPLLAAHDEVERAVVMVVTSDRGLAGGFNSNVLREAEKLIKAKQQQGIVCDVIACGKKAIGYFNYRKITPVLEFRDMSADPTYEEAEAIAHYVSEAFLAGELDEVIILFNHAKNSAEQIFLTRQLLPVDRERFEDIFGAPKVAHTSSESNQDASQEASSSRLVGDVVFEPNVGAVMHKLTKAYIRDTIYHTLIDSAAAEQGARRTAMKSATDNANEMVETLTRLYNRVRQGAITTEISEIVGGAAALED